MIPIFPSTHKMIKKAKVETVESVVAATSSRRARKLGCLDWRYTSNIFVVSLVSS